MPYFGASPSSTLASADLNGQALILDADADTTITADTDDQIDIRISGADDFRFTANTLTALAGSTIAAQALTATTLTGSGVLSIDDTTDSTSGTSGSIHTDGGLGVAKDIYVGSQITIQNGSAGAPSINLAGDTDTGLYWTSQALAYVTDTTERARFAASNLYLADTANANMTAANGGITINQTDADNEILALKSSDVAHGMTDETETDTFGLMEKEGAAGGGLRIQGATEGTVGMQLAANVVSVNTTKTSSGRASNEIRTYKKSGTAVGNTGANANMLLVSADGDVAGFIVDSDGDVFIDGSQSAFDEYDDGMMLRTFMQEQTPKGIIKTEFDKWVKYNKKSLEESGIIGTIDPDNPDHYHKDGTLSRPLVCMTQLQRLEVGAIVQQRAMFETLKSVVEEMLPGFADKLNERLEEQHLPALPA